MKFDAGDTLDFEDGRSYTFPKPGNYLVKGKFTKYNGTDLNIDWSGKANSDEEALSKAIEVLRQSISMNSKREQNEKEVKE
jgi:PKD repeat protein